MYTASAVDVKPKCRWKQALTAANSSLWASQAAHWRHTHAHVTAGAGQKKGGKSRLANMWSKAPAVKEKPQKGKAAAATKAQAVPAVDADAALRSAQQVANAMPAPQSGNRNLLCSVVGPSVLCSVTCCFVSAVCLWCASTCSVLHRVHFDGLWFTVASLVCLFLNLICMALALASPSWHPFQKCCAAQPFMSLLRLVTHHCRDHPVYLSPCLPSPCLSCPTAGSTQQVLRLSDGGHLRCNRMSCSTCLVCGTLADHKIHHQMFKVRVFKSSKCLPYFEPTRTTTVDST